MRVARAFTLIELAVALAIAGIVTASALTATVQIQRSFAGARQRLTQNDDARLALEHILDRVRVAGGGLVRPWQAISTSCGLDGLHPMPPCDPAQRQRRLHVLELQPTGQGAIVSVSGNTVVVAAPGGECPLTTSQGYGAQTPVVLVPPERHLATTGGAVWRTGLCAAVASPSAPCVCTLQAPGNVGFRPPTSGGTLVPDSLLAGGVIARGLVISIFVDPAQKLLLERKDFMGSGVAVQTGLVPDAVAFDVVYAYDVDNDGTLDERLDDPRTSAQDTLRAMRVGLALSSPTRSGQAIAATLLGTPLSRPGEVVLSMEGSALMRASGVFQ